MHLPASFPTATDRRGCHRLRRGAGTGGRAGRHILPRGAGRHGQRELRDIRAGGLAERAAGQRLRRRRLLLPRVHQPVRACVHAARLPRGLGGQSQRPAAGQPGGLGPPQGDHSQAHQRRNRNRGTADRRYGGIRQPVPCAPAMAAAMEARDAAHRGRAARLPAEPDRLHGDPLPAARMRAHRTGLDSRWPGNAWRSPSRYLNSRRDSSLACLPRPGSRPLPDLPDGRLPRTRLTRAAPGPAACQPRRAARALPAADAGCPLNNPAEQMNPLDDGFRGHAPPARGLNPGASSNLVRGAEEEVP